MTLHCRATLMAVALFLIASCARQISGPVEPFILVWPLQLQPGEQLLLLRGYALSNDPTLPLCAPLGVPTGGTAVATTVVLERSGDAWVARSNVSGEDLELWFRETGTMEMGGTAVTGTMRGRATDLQYTPELPARDVTIAVAGPAGVGVGVLSGRTVGRSVVLVGQVTGQMTFRDSLGAQSTCGFIDYILQPMKR